MIGKGSAGQVSGGMRAKVEVVAELGDAATDLRALMEAHFDFVWRSLRRLGVDDAGLDDAAQKVWIVASRSADPIRPESARSYLFAIASRVASEARRTLRRSRHVQDERAIETARDRAELPDETVDRVRARAILDEILDAMDDELRAVFVLFELEQMSSPEIARALGIPVGTVASRLRRAREVFARELKRRARTGGGA